MMEKKVYCKLRRDGGAEWPSFSLEGKVMEATSAGRRVGENHRKRRKTLEEEVAEEKRENTEIN